MPIVDFSREETDERVWMDRLVLQHPRLCGWRPTPQGSMSRHDGWIYSGADMELIVEVKIRQKKSTDEIKLNVSKLRALQALAMKNGTTPVLFDFCLKDQTLIIMPLDIEPIRMAHETFYDKVFKKERTGYIAFWSPDQVAERIDMNTLIQ